MKNKPAINPSVTVNIMQVSGGSRNLERGVQSPAREARRKFWVATPTFGHVNAFIQI